MNRLQRRWRLAQWGCLGLFTSLLLPFSGNAAITITTNLPSYYSFNNVIQGVAFQGTGAQTPLAWSVSAGALPPGLNLSATGLFSGTPSKAGTYTFTVTATAPQEAGNTPGTKTFTIGIPQITTSTVLPPAAVGVPYSIQFQSSDGPSTGAVWSVSLGGLPLGLTVDPHTGIYSGTPIRTGTFSLAVSVSFGVAFATEQVSLTINAAGPQTLSVSPAALSFTASTGALSGSQNLAVSNTATSAVSFTVQIDDGQGGPAPAWLNVSPMGGITPGLLRVSLVPPALAVGTYNARIRIGLAGASAPPVDVPVQLTVSNPPPNLTAAPLLLRFRALATNSGTESQTFLLRNTGGGAAIPFQLSVVGKSPWIAAVNSSSQTIASDTPVEVTVTVNSQGLAAGSFRDAIRVTTPLAPPFDQFDLPVTITIANQGPIMGLSLSGLRFATTQANQGSTTEQVFVEDLGSAGTTVNWTAQAVQGGDVVSLVSPQGSSTPGNPTAFGVRLSATAASSAGGKFALIQVSDSLSQNAPQYVVVVADVAAAGTPPVPVPEPAGLFFSASSVPNSAPPAQQVAVNTPSASPVAFSIAASTDDGAGWLTASAGSGTTSQSSPAQISVSVSPGSLTPGVYRGTVNVAIGAIVRGVSVTLLVLASQKAAAIGAVRPAAAASCVPAAVVLAATGLFQNFSVPAGWPASLAIEANDDCGNALVDASVVASFSNGDPPITLIPNGNGPDYSATWQPGSTASQMTVTVDATAGPLKSAEFQLGGNVNSNARPAPSLVAGGLLNNLNPQLGAPLAPGTVAQVYGDNLADSPDQPGIVPLPTSFKNVQVLIGPLTAPLFYVSKGQLVAQIPTELAPQQTYSAVILVGDQFTLPQNIDLTSVAPGTVAFADGTLVAQHSDFTLVGVDFPAKPGEALTIYLVGMGPTTPSVPSGTAAPSDPLARVQADVEVTVDGQPAQVTFAGLTPGGVGLYQINFVVPSNAKTGKLDVVITENGFPANATTLTVAQ